jgi:hypothetical protein
MTPACRSGKVAYPTRTAALAALRRIMQRWRKHRRGRRITSDLGEYQCRACRRWHLGRHDGRE